MRKDGRITISKLTLGSLLDRAGEKESLIGAAPEVQLEHA
jgi:hypothetical protein